MPNRRKSIYVDTEHHSNVLAFDVEEISFSSPRKNGHLMLAQQPYSRKMARLIIGTSGKYAYFPSPSVKADRRYPESLDWASIDNVALAKFNNELRYGSASLGMTLGSWRQSREMIVRRTKDLGDAADRAREALKRNPKWLAFLRKGKRDPLANQVLEYKFGWKPLITDIHTALTTVCSDAIPPEFVTVRHRRHIRETVQAGSPPITGWRQDWEGFARTTVSARVYISNPNLWLLNRMGLINPVTVAWDLVPWSFVVNMFVNADAMIGSITDHVGLCIEDKSTTRTWKGLCRYQEYSRYYPVEGYSDNRILWSDKHRVVGSIPSYSWEFKVPKLNWDLAVTASSLALQKVKKLNSLIRGI